MKKVTNKPTKGFQISVLSEDARHLIKGIKKFGKEGAYFEMECDLLAFGMPALIESKSFSDLPGERRKELFNQFLVLKSVLRLLSDYVTEYRDKSIGKSIGETFKFIDETNDLISCLKDFGDCESYFDMNNDLLPLIARELYTNQTFTKLPSQRRTELYVQESSLICVLEILEKYIPKAYAKIAS